MKEEARRGPFEGTPVAAEDEIEILEVVGIDEDAPPPGDAAADGDDALLFADDDASAPAAVPASEAAAAGRAEREELPERMLRLQADFENFRKRVERDREEFRAQANSALVARLLPILDNFERALGCQQSDEYDSFRDGVALIFRQLMEELGQGGLRPVESLGRPFDPAVHEAVTTELSTELPPHTILEELQRGYFFKDRLLRPALVKVSVGPGGEDPEESLNG